MNVPVCAGKTLEFCRMRWKLREFYGSSEVIFCAAAREGGREGGREREVNEI
jgi:hypothetical protein